MHTIDNIGKEEVAKHEFDLLKLPKHSKIEVRHARQNDALGAAKLVNTHLATASQDVDLIKKIISINNDGFFIFEKNKELIGLYVMLMLNALGQEKLLLNEFDTTKPPENCIAKNPDDTACIYVWAYVAPGQAANGIRHVSHYLNNSNYKSKNFFARPVTSNGLKMAKNLGFKPVQTVNEGLYRYTRLINLTPPLQQVA